MRPATVAVHAGRPPHQPDQPLNAPITMAATYVAGGATEYGRYGNPTWTAPAGEASWVNENALILAVGWPVVIIAVFAPLAVRAYRRLGG